jgi:hypothetical protein
MFEGADFLRRQWNQLVLGFNAERQKNLLSPLGHRRSRCLAAGHRLRRRLRAAPCW